MGTNVKKSEIDQFLDQVCSYTAKRDLDKAVEMLDEAYSVDFDSKDTSELYRMVKFWQKRWMRLNDLSSPFEKGDYLLNQWDQFLFWIKNRDSEYVEKGILALKHMVHSAGKEFYEILQNEEMDDISLCLRIGQCNKVLGNYEKASVCFEHGARINRESPQILAELADTYALMDEMQGAKIFFREAFFINPQEIDLSRLESGLIRKVIDKIRALGYTGSIVNEWLPVYAVLFGVFNVKRELRAIEYGKLKQSIYSLQSDLRQNDENEVLIPRLINKYFWLIDHYISIKEDRSTIDEVLMNIKLLSPSIYQQYIN